MKRFLSALLVLLWSSAALAQNAGTVTEGAYAIGRGPGVVGYTSLLCSAGQLAVGQAGAPICRTVSGDWTLNAAGVSTLATVNANVGAFGSATQSVVFTVNAKGLITAAANVTVTPAVGSITGLGANVATWLGAPSSANLRAAVTDETGTGALYFQGGDVGTPSAGNGSNLTALNATQLTTGTIPAARTNGHQNGTGTNDNAAAGEIGEEITASVASGSAIALTSNAAKTITSIVLTPGDWDVSGQVAFTSTATTSFTINAGSLSTVTDTSSAVLGRWNQHVGAAFVPNGIPISAVMGPSRFTVATATTTTVYLVAFATFTVSTSGGYGIISARRAR
jgi:hypothetical protein